MAHQPSGGLCSTSTRPTLGTFLVYVLGFIACVLLFLHTWNERHQRAANGISWGSSSGSKTSQMELQVSKKQAEIMSLRSELDQLVQGGQQAEKSMQVQEETIKKLQVRVEAERIAREKAHFAFSERALALDKCHLHQSELEVQVNACSHDLDGLKRIIRP